MIEIDNSVSKLISNETARIAKVKKQGPKYSVHYLGVNTQKSGNKMLAHEQISELEVLANDGEFNFKDESEKFVFFAETELIKSAYHFDSLFAINCSVVDLLPHPVEAVYKLMLPQPRTRFLIADDTEDGKTIMTGLLIKELMMHHTIERVLIVTPGLTKQWQEDEMDFKFNLPFILVDWAAFSGNPTIFHTEDHVVTSIDFLRWNASLEFLHKNVIDVEDNPNTYIDDMVVNFLIDVIP